MSETPTCGRPILLPCPKCGAPEANIAGYLGVLGDEEQEQFHCGDCEADFSVGFVRDLATKWAKVLAWLDTAPNVED